MTASSTPELSLDQASFLTPYITSEDENQARIFALIAHSLASQKPIPAEYLKELTGVSDLAKHIQVLKDKHRFDIQQRTDPNVGIVYYLNLGGVIK